MDSGGAHTCCDSGLHHSLAHVVGEGDAHPKTTETPVLPSKRSVLNASPGYTQPCSA